MEGSRAFQSHGQVFITSSNVSRSSAKLSQTVLNTVLERQAQFRHDLQGLEEIYETGNVADMLRPEDGCQCTCNLQNLLIWYTARLASTSYCQTITLYSRLLSKLRENIHISELR
jgi:hypothetical protein